MSTLERRQRRIHTTNKKKGHCLSTVEKVEQIVSKGAKAILISGNADNEAFYEQVRKFYKKNFWLLSNH